MGHDVEGPNVHIGADASQVDKALAKAGQAIEHFGHAMHALEGAFGFEKIKETFMEVVNHTAKAELGQRKFEGAMLASGQAADPAKFYALAEALEKTTTFQADTTIEAGAMMARFKLTQEQIQGLIPHVQDLATFMGQDLVSSADAMGRAISVGAEGLRGLGLGFTHGEKQAFQLANQQQRVAMITAKMAAMNGTAAAFARTAAGASQQYAVATENLGQVFGKIIDKPVAMFFQKLTEETHKLTDWFKALSPQARDTVAAIAAGVGVIGAAAAGMAILSGAIGMASTILPAITAGFGAIFGVLTTIVLPIGLAIGAFFAMKTAWDDNTKVMGKGLHEWVADIKSGFDDLVKGIKDKLSVISDFAIWVGGKITRKSDDEIAGMITASHEQAGGIFNPEAAEQGAKEMATPLVESAKEFGARMKVEMKDAIQFLLDGAGEMGKKIKAQLKALGINISGLGGHERQAGAAHGGESAADAKNAQLAGMRQAAENISAYWHSAAGIFAKGVAAVKGVAEQVGMNLLQAGGAVGQMMSNVIQSLGKGDIAGAATAALTGFITQSKSFQAVVAHMNDIFAELSQALNPLFDGLAPVLGAIRTVAAAVGGTIAGIFRSLQPLFAIIGVVAQVVATTIAPIFTTVFRPLQSAFGILSQVLKAVLPLVKMAGDVLSIFGPLIGHLSAVLEPVTIVLNLLKPAFEALHEAFTHVGIAVLQFAMFISKMWNTIIDGIAGFLDQVADALPKWAGGDALHEFAKTVRGADIDLQKMQDTITAMGDTTMDTEGQFNELQQPIAALGSSADQASEGLSNAPSGFKVALERFNAALESGGGAHGGADPYFGSTGQGAATQAVSKAVQAASQGPGSDRPSVNIENLNVPASGDTGQKAVTAIQAAMRQAMFRMTGSTEGTYPNATPRTSPLPAGA